jgi:hypothetical protein
VCASPIALLTGRAVPSPARIQFYFEHGATIRGLDITQMAQLLMFHHLILPPDTGEWPPLRFARPRFLPCPTNALFGTPGLLLVADAACLEIKRAVGPYRRLGNVELRFDFGNLAASLLPVGIGERACPTFFRAGMSQPAQ